MKKGSLPIGWVRWRRCRYQRLAAEGLPSHLAWDIAAGEAKGRYRVSRIIGNRAARNVEMGCVSISGKLRFFLSGGVGDLTDEQLAEIEELNCRSKKSA